MTAYQAALTEAPRPIGEARTLPGSVNAAVATYYQSLAFRELATSTRYMRRCYLEKFREQHGDKRIALMPSDFIARMLDKLEPFSARNWLKSLRALMQHAVSTGLCKVDPTQGVKLRTPKTDGIHAWSEVEIEQYESHHAVGTKARLALALALYTGQRRAELIRMGRQHVRNGAIEVRQQKTRAVLEIPLHANLLAVMAATPSDHLTFLVTRTGRPYAPNDFSDQFRQWCDEATIAAHCSMHGLRKAAARRLAEAGCSTNEIASVTGHRTLKEVERYTRSADQARLARRAMSRTKVTNL